MKVQLVIIYDSRVTAEIGVWGILYPLGHERVKVLIRSNFSVQAVRAISCGDACGYW
jgi:hypothetical protein